MKNIKKNLCLLSLSALLLALFFLANAKEARAESLIYENNWTTMENVVLCDGPASNQTYSYQNFDWGLLESPSKFVIGAWSPGESGWPGAIIKLTCFFDDGMVQDSWETGETALCGGGSYCGAGNHSTSTLANVEYRLSTAEKESYQTELENFANIPPAYCMITIRDIYPNEYYAGRYGMWFYPKTDNNNVSGCIAGGSNKEIPLKVWSADENDENIPSLNYARFMDESYEMYNTTLNANATTTIYANTEVGIIAGKCQVIGDNISLNLIHNGTTTKLYDTPCENTTNYDTGLPEKTFAAQVVLPYGTSTLIALDTVSSTTSYFSEDYPINFTYSDNPQLSNWIDEGHDYVTSTPAVSSSTIEQAFDIVSTQNLKEMACTDEEWTRSESGWFNFTKLSCELKFWALNLVYKPFNWLKEKMISYVEQMATNVWPFSTFVKAKAIWETASSTAGF